MSTTQTPTRRTPHHVTSSGHHPAGTAAKPHARAADKPATDLMRPGPEHAQLAKNIGTWDVAYTHWMTAGAEPSTGIGTATFSSVFDGRYIREDFTGDFGGKPFSGVGTMGFDRAARQYVNTWYDSMGTGILCTSGTTAGGSRDIVLRGTMTCPMQKSETRVRHVYARESDDRFTLTMFNQDSGAEWKAMALVYTRKT